MNNLDKLFDLGNFEESTNVDDIMDTEISEGAENDLATGKKVSPDQTNISVPGGISDSTKPADGEYGPKPGEADKNHQPTDKADVSIPASTTLTADQYNAALAALKKSFKEGVQIMEILESATIVHKTLEEEQAEYTESVLAEAYVQAIEDGPIFEKVNREDKNNVKDIVRKIRKDIKNDIKDMDLHWQNVGTLGKIFSGAWLTTRLWSILGLAITQPTDIDDICKKLTKKYADELGDYRIMPVITGYTPTLKAAWKNGNATAYLLVVDKKLEDLRDIKDGIKKEEAAKKDDKKEKAVKESVEEDSNDELLTEKKKCKKCEEDDECCKKDKKSCKDEDKKDEK